MIGYPLGPGGNGKLFGLLRRLWITPLSHQITARPAPYNIVGLDRRAIVRGVDERIHHLYRQVVPRSASASYGENLDGALDVEEFRVVVDPRTAKCYIKTNAKP